MVGGEKSPVRFMIAVAGLTATIGMVGCLERPEPRSAIVQKAQDAGAGDLPSASKNSIRQWLGQHRSVAAEIESMCAAVRGNAPASWGDTTEGRLCAAAHQLTFTTTPPGGVKSDGRTFRPGTH
jgi:hypothetical protein